MATSASSLAPENQLLYEQLLDALHTLFGGVHPGYRAIHAKGIVCQGTFSPAATAASVSRASHLQGAPVPITVRFSDFAGVPTVSDSDPLASPRGMAIKFHLPGGIDTDIVAQSYDGFPVRTAEEFLVFVRALAASGPGSRARHRSPTSWQVILRRSGSRRRPNRPRPVSPRNHTTASTPSALPTGKARAATVVTGSARKRAKNTWTPLRRPAGRGVFCSTSLPRDSPAALPGSASSFSSRTKATRSMTARCRGPKNGRRSSWVPSPSPPWLRTARPLSAGSSLTRPGLWTASNSRAIRCLPPGPPCTPSRTGVATPDRAGSTSGRRQGGRGGDLQRGRARLTYSPIRYTKPCSSSSALQGPYRSCSTSSALIGVECESGVRQATLRDPADAVIAR